MKKILIIDDRPKRKERHLSKEALAQLAILEDKEMLTTSTGFENLSENLDSIFKPFDMIAIHNSYLSNLGIYGEVTEYIKKSEKYLIVFSGGIPQNTILNKGQQLNINSTDFYTDKLPSFIESFCNESIITNPLLKYLYGDSWKLTLLLQYRYLLWKYADIKKINVDKEYKLAKQLKSILWDGNINKSIEDINKEIELEKERRINL